MKPLKEEDWLKLLGFSPLALSLIYTVLLPVIQNEVDSNSDFANYVPVRGKRGPSRPPHSPRIAVRLPHIHLGFQPEVKFSRAT